MTNQEKIVATKLRLLCLLRIFTDRKAEFCGLLQHCEYHEYLRTISSHGSGCNAIAFRKKIYTSIEQLQICLDEWAEQYNRDHTYSGKHCFGRTPLQAFREAKHLAQVKQLDMLVDILDIPDTDK